MLMETELDRRCDLIQAKTNVAAMPVVFQAYKTSLREKTGQEKVANLATTKELTTW